MKKSIIAIIAVGAACAAAAGLGGCKSCDGDKPVSGYGKLQGLLSKNYSQIVLTVTDKFDEDTSLVSKYTLAYGDSDVTVTYSIEEFSSLSIDSADAQFKTVKNGSAVIKDGVVVQITGDSAELPSTEVISAGGMTFNEEYFSEASISDVAFKANVINPSGFFGRDVVCSDMKINAVFGDFLAEMEITYKAKSGQSVEYVYEFTAKL